MSYIPVLAILNFQQTLLQSSVPHDPSEIIVICGFLVLKKHLLLLGFLWWIEISKEQKFYDLKNKINK